jgi:sec-independent protein translocase protein TatA
MPDIGLPEIAIIAIIILFLFGAQRLPKLGKSLGQGISSFKKGLNGAYDDDDDNELTGVVKAEAESAETASAETLADPSAVTVETSDQALKPA